MRDYVLCARKNRATLTGYILLVIPIILFVFGPSLTMTNNFLPLVIYIHIIWLGMAFLLVTRFGLETLDTYRRTKKVIQQYGLVKARFLIRPSMYCTRVGFNLACQEVQRSKLFATKERN